MGQGCGPERTDDLSLDVQEDVFGDKVVVGGAQGYYTYTYRLLDANTLTVAQRDAFSRPWEKGGAPDGERDAAERRNEQKRI